MKESQDKLRKRQRVRKNILIFTKDARISGMLMISKQ